MPVDLSGITLPTPEDCGALPTLACIQDGIQCYNSTSPCFGFLVKYKNISTFQLIPNSLCTPDICPLIYDQAHFDYAPALSPNVIVAALFGILLLLQIGLAIKWKTWGFLAGMFGGIVLEIMGYIGRVMMSSNPFTKNPFLIYLICATIGPAFLSASIYMCLARMIVAYGENLSRFKPRTYTMTFVSCDLISLALQAAGGGLASTATTQDQQSTGINIMIGGLAFQVVSLSLFSILCADFGVHVIKGKSSRNALFADVWERLRFKLFLGAIGVVTAAIFIRSTYRVVELKQGFHGSLASDENLYMLLEGGMILLAVTALSVLHPGFAFSGRWAEANFRFKPEASKLEA